jgi:hypothetical protein
MAKGFLCCAKERPLLVYGVANSRQGWSQAWPLACGGRFILLLFGRGFSVNVWRGRSETSDGEKGTDACLKMLLLHFDAGPLLNGLWVGLFNVGLDVVLGDAKVSFRR